MIFKTQEPHPKTKSRLLQIHISQFLEEVPFLPPFRKRRPEKSSFLLMNASRTKWSELIMTIGSCTTQTVKGSPNLMDHSLHFWNHCFSFLSASEDEARAKQIQNCIKDICFPRECIVASTVALFLHMSTQSLETDLRDVINGYLIRNNKDHNKTQINTQYRVKNKFRAQKTE